MNWILVVGLVALIFLALLLLTCFLLAGFSMKIKRQNLEEARKWQEDHYDLSWYDPLEKTDYTVQSGDGYQLHVQFLKNPAPTDRYMLISHGYTDNRFGSLKYAGMYLNLGFHVIIYDLRGHGLNQETFCTYSIRERKDLMALILDSRKRYPDMTFFGIHGESLGAATSVAVLEEKPPVNFVVADCGFCEIIPVLRGALGTMHLPKGLISLASLFAKIRYGYAYSQMRPLDSLKENRIPILFMHGAEDKFILPEHSERMRQATRGYAELHLIPGAEHAMSILTDPKSYQQLVSDFINTVSRTSEKQ